MAFGLKNTMVLAERRRAERRSVEIAAIARPLGGDAVPIVIEVLSARGMLAKSPQVFAKGAIVNIGFPSGRAPRARVMWIEDGKIGCQFASPVDVEALLDASVVHRLDAAGLLAAASANDRDDGDVDAPAAAEAEAPVPDECDMEPGSDGGGEDDWLDCFGWLAIGSYEHCIGDAGGWLRPVLLRRGTRWAFGGRTEGGWVHMSDAQLAKPLAFEPLLWTPVSDALAIELMVGA